MITDKDAFNAIKMLWPDTTSIYNDRNIFVVVNGDNSKTKLKLSDVIWSNEDEKYPMVKNYSPCPLCGMEMTDIDDNYLEHPVNNDCPYVSGVRIANKNNWPILADKKDK